MLTNFAIFDFGLPELIIILAIILLLFGGKKLPQLSKSIGESMKELRKGFGEGNDPKSSDKQTSTDSTPPEAQDTNSQPQ